MAVIDESLRLQNQDGAARFKWMYTPHGNRVDRLSFECSQCGECCSHLGLMYAIQEDLGNYRYYLRNKYTGESFLVSVDPDKISLYHDMTVFSERPEACPFFRYDTRSANGFCTIHLTRPDVCREYDCWRLLILDPHGNRAGRIMCSRHLASDDPVLTRIFDEEINQGSIADDATWDRRVVQVLERAGYTVRN